MNGRQVEIRHRFSTDELIDLFRHMTLRDLVTNCQFLKLHLHDQTYIIIVDQRFLQSTFLSWVSLKQKSFET